MRKVKQIPGYSLNFTKKVLRQPFSSPEEGRRLVMGLLFIKYADRLFYRARARLKELDEDAYLFDFDNPKTYEQYYVFYIPPSAHWAYLTGRSNYPGVGAVIDNAVEALKIENSKYLLWKRSLPTGYADAEARGVRFGKLFATIERAKTTPEVDELTYSHRLLYELQTGHELEPHLERVLRDNVRKAFHLGSGETLPR